MKDNAGKVQRPPGKAGEATCMIFGEDMSVMDIVEAIRTEGRRQESVSSRLSATTSTALVAGVGELDICVLCDSSPHPVGCPEHRDFDDDRVSYALAAAPNDFGPASYWVNDTFALAASEAGLDSQAALAEGIEEFMAALKLGELRRANSR